MNITVWRGTYTEKGQVFKATIRVDGDALAGWFGGSGHSTAAFRKAHKEGSARAERLNGGVIVKLTAQPKEDGK